jgi:threonine/homoserine/homoserine lactone efflux protein
VTVPEPQTLALFALASLALIAVPGPSVLYIVTRSVSQGRRAGLVSVLGIEAGALVHVSAAALGVSALVASSATAFTVLKYAGAAYLVYLGIRKLRERLTEPAPDSQTDRRTDRRLFWEGALVNALNPKTATFFVAFLPQFVDPARGSVALQALLLGFLFVAVAVVSDAVWALLAGGVGRRLRTGRGQTALARASASVYLGLGAASALAEGRPARR